MYIPVSQKNELILTDLVLLQTSSSSSSSNNTLRMLLPNTSSPHPLPRSKGPPRRLHHSIWQVQKFRLLSRTIRHGTRAAAFQVLGSHRLSLFSKYLLHC